MPTRLFDEESNDSNKRERLAAYKQRFQKKLAQRRKLETLTEGPDDVDESAEPFRNQIKRHAYAIGSDNS